MGLVLEGLHCFGGGLVQGEALLGGVLDFGGLSFQLQVGVCGLEQCGEGEVPLLDKVNPVLESLFPGCHWYSCGVLGYLSAMR